MAEEPGTDDSLSDSELIASVLAGENERYGVIVRRYNRRIYRIIRAILQSDDEAEDVTQEAFLRAFQHLRRFEGRALFSTWLTRIAVHEALNRRKQRRKETGIDTAEIRKRRAERTNGDQERRVLHDELRRLLEAAIDALPEPYRLVFVMRHIEDMSTVETARSLDVTEETVKMRLVRDRKMLRLDILDHMKEAGSAVFLLLGERCDRIRSNVLAGTTIQPYMPSLEI